MIVKVFSIDLMGIYFSKFAAKCADKGSIVFDSEGPAIKQNATIRAQTQNIIAGVGAIMR